MNVYQYTSKFNASHSHTPDGADVHIHSFVVTTYLKYVEHMTYDHMEQHVKAYLAQYKGQYLNDKLGTVATLEAIGDHLFDQLDGVVGPGNLLSLELSDSPVQMYRIRRAK